jgi:Family of unknown function (DUF5681)
MSRKNRPAGTVRSSQDKKPRTDPSPRDYPVGYGKPPVASRFKPGTSGNAKGRRKGSKNFKTLIKEAMTSPILIQEGATSRRVSKIEGVVLRQLQSALKGDERSAMASIKMAMLVGLLDDSDKTASEDTALSAADEQIIEQLMARHRKATRR